MFKIYIFLYIYIYIYVKTQRNTLNLNSLSQNNSCFPLKLTIYSMSKLQWKNTKSLKIFWISWQTAKNAHNKS